MPSARSSTDCRPAPTPGPRRARPRSPARCPRSHRDLGGIGPGAARRPGDPGGRSGQPAWNGPVWLDGSMTKVSIGQALTLERFGINANSQVFRRTQNLIDPLAWSDWTEFGGTLRPSVAPHTTPTAASPGNLSTVADTRSTWGCRRRAADSRTRGQCPDCRPARPPARPVRSPANRREPARRPTFGWTITVTVPMSSMSASRGDPGRTGTRARRAAVHLPNRRGHGQRPSDFHPTDAGHRSGSGLHRRTRDRKV
jgi:hypothetical protein